MSDYDTEAVEGTDLEQRDVRALTEVMTVLADQGRVRDAAGKYEVVSSSGSAYLVDPLAGTCECRDFQKREPAGGCKHLRRVAFTIGERDIPTWVDTDALADELVEQAESSDVSAVDVSAVEQPVVTDGGTQRRVCDDCAHMSGLPCFDCYLAGHESPAGAIESGDAVAVELGDPSEGA